MIRLAPPLFLAAVYHLLEEGEARPDGQLRFGRRGRGSADLELIHRIGMSSHRDPVVQRSPWPLGHLDSALLLRRFAQRHELLRTVPAPGDLLIMSASDSLYGGTVAVVTRVLERGFPPHESPWLCELLFGVADAEDARWMKGIRMDRWCGSARGDVVVRWGDLGREVAA